MCKSKFALALLAAWMAACTSTEPGVSDTRPSAIGVGSSAQMEVVPAVVTARPNARVSCPDNPPFLGSISVNIRPGVSAITLTDVRLRFTDTTGAFSAPQVTLPAPVPTQQFGSGLVAARTVAQFPFSFGFGCGTGRTGTLVVIVVTTDDRGRSNVNEMNVRVQ